MTNKQIAAKIRKLGKKNGLTNDRQITMRAGCYADTILNIESLKTAPRIDTLSKFSRAFGVGIEDLIYDRSEVQMELSAFIADFSERELLELIVYAKMMRKEKNNKMPKAA